MQHNLREILRTNAVNSNLKELELLLDHYPHLLSEHKNKFNLLHIALQNNDVKLMKLLANYNVNPNIKYKGLSPLHLAVQNEVDIQIIKLLISLSADINIIDKYGNTPFHFAAKLGNTNVIKELINAGANINYMNEAYLTPLEIAQKHKKHKAVDMISKAGVQKKKSFLETLKIAFSTSSIYRKATILAVTVALLTVTITASILTHGLLFPTIILSILASIGLSIVCLVKPFFRVKFLERKMMNRQVNNSELKKLFRQLSNLEENSDTPATNIAEEINDNYFLTQYKNCLEKSEKTKKLTTIN